MRTRALVLLASLLFVGGCKVDPNYPFKVHTLSNGMECTTLYEAIVECRRDGVVVQLAPRP